MKKTYIYPEIEIVNIKMTQNLLTASSLSFGDSVDSAAGAEARDFDFDDEDF